MRERCEARCFVRRTLLDCHRGRRSRPKSQDRDLRSGSAHSPRAGADRLHGVRRVIARSSGGESARLFPKLQQGSKGGFGEAFSKWFGRYKRSLGIDNEKSVFHSFRHGFKDALRAAGVNEDVNDALTGHSGGNTVARGYGSDDMVRRFGFRCAQRRCREGPVPRPRPVALTMEAVDQVSRSANPLDGEKGRTRAPEGNPVCGLSVVKA